MLGLDDQHELNFYSDNTLSLFFMHLDLS